MDKPLVFNFRKYKELSESHKALCEVHEKSIGQNVRLHLDNEDLRKRNRELEHTIEQLKDRICELNCQLFEAKKGESAK